MEQKDKKDNAEELLSLFDSTQSGQLATDFSQWATEQPSQIRQTNTFKKRVIITSIVIIGFNILGIGFLLKTDTKTSSSKDLHYSKLDTIQSEILLNPKP